MSAVWLILWGLLIVVLGIAVVLRFRENDKADHAKCVALISSVASDRMVATALRELADRYDSMDGQGELATIRSAYQSMTFEPESSVPAAWLRLQADKIDPPSEDWNYNEVAL